MRGELLTVKVFYESMSSPDKNTIPLPIQVLLEQETDEECNIFLVYDAITANDEFTKGKLVASSTITEAKYTISDKFSLPVENIQAVEPEGETANRKIWIGGCSEADLEALFDSVTIAYSLGEETAEIGN